MNAKKAEEKTEYEKRRNDDEEKGPAACICTRILTNMKRRIRKIQANACVCMFQRLESCPGVFLRRKLVSLHNPL